MSVSRFYSAAEAIARARVVTGSEEGGLGELFSHVASGDIGTIARRVVYPKRTGNRSSRERTELNATLAAGFWRWNGYWRGPPPGGYYGEGFATGHFLTSEGEAFGVRFDADAIDGVFPDPRHSAATGAAVSKAHAEAKAVEWLETQFATAPRSKSKPEFLAEASVMIGGLSRRAFDRAWGTAAATYPERRARGRKTERK